MSIESENYGRAFQYEILMRRAYRTADRNLTKGIDNSVYRHLYFIPAGSALTRTTYDQQIEKVKKFLLRTSEKILKWNLTEEERTKILSSVRVISNTYDEAILYGQIKDLLETTHRFKEYSFRFD